MTFYKPHPCIAIYRTRSPWYRRVPLAAWAVLLAAVLAFWAWA